MASADPDDSSGSEYDTDSDISSISGMSERLLDINYDTDSENEDNDGFLGFGEVAGNRQFHWTKEFYPRPNIIPDFIGQTGPTHPLPGDATALQYFQKFIDDVLIAEWIEYTHQHAITEIREHPERNKSQWIKPTLDEMHIFVAILIVTNYGIQPARIEQLWSRKEKDWIMHTPNFSLIMNQHRFRIIKRYFRVASENYIENNQRDPARKIRPLLTHLLDKFETEWSIGEMVTIDEIMIPFKGRFRGKQYMRNKPVKWGLRVDALVDQSTKYLWRFRLYTGKVQVADGLQSLGVMGYIIVLLMAGLENRGHKLTVDRGYSAPTLFDYLAELGIGANGTCNTARKGYPKVLLKKGKGVRGEWDWLRAGNLVAVRWFDSRHNYFLSNFHYPDHEVVNRQGQGGDRIDVRATTMVKSYNEFMNGVDVLDQKTRVAKDRKQSKWYMRAFVKALEWVLHNAMVLEENNPNRAPRPRGRKRDMMDFRLEVVHALIGEHRLTKKNTSNSQPTTRKTDQNPGAFPSGCCNNGLFLCCVSGKIQSVH